MPWMVSSRGYGFLLDSTWLNRFDLTGHGPLAGGDGRAGAALARLRGPEPADVLQRVTTDPLVGRQPPPAEWFFGPWYQPTGDDRVPRLPPHRVAHAGRAEGGLDVPVTVAQTYTHYLPCAAQAGGRAAGRERANADAYHSWGYRVTTYVNSFVCRDHPDGAYATGRGQRLVRARPRSAPPTRSPTSPS